jgi:CheY-like chemotaxis protein
MPNKKLSVVNMQNAAGQKKFVLIVDDEFDLTSVFSMLFESNGFETVTAGNGQIALEKIRQRTPDLILSDFMMPVMDGVQLARQIRNNPATAHIPLILMSAMPQHQDLAGSAASAFVQKPFQFKHVLEVALRLLSPKGKDQASS